MAHTWIHKPDVVVPPVVKGVYHAGFAIKQMPAYWFARLDVEATIKGSLRCDGAQIRNVETVVRANVMIPIDPAGMAVGAVMKGMWLKTTWWITRGASIVAPILRKEEQVEKVIKSYIDNSDKICLGASNLTARQYIELKEPIWLNENYQPMYVLPPGRAQLNPKTDRRLV